MNASLVEISAGTAAIVALTGYLVVFLGLILLMAVVMAVGRAMGKKQTETSAVPVAESAPAPDETRAAPAPGSAGELKLYDTDPRTAAMLMAIVADELGKPINELRFLSIREVK